ncbi:hypothetical protein Tco_0107417 [Tanacetum coccineum]
MTSRRPDILNRSSTQTTELPTQEDQIRGYRSMTRVYQHYSKQKILCANDNQTNLPLCNQQSYQSLRTSGLQHIHLGIFMIRLHALHRRSAGTNALLVLKCTGEMKQLAEVALYSVEEVLQSPYAFQKNTKITCEEVMKISNHFQESSQKLSSHMKNQERYTDITISKPIRIDKSSA